MRRPNQFEIDPKNLDEFVKKNVDTDLATPEQIAQRKIVRVARGQDKKEAQPEKITLKIDFGTPSNDKPNTQKISSLFSNPAPTESKPTTEQEPKKASNLFSGLLSGPSLFNNKPNQAPKSQQQKPVQKETAKKNTTQQTKPSLFNFSFSSNITPSTSMFSNLLTGGTPSTGSGGLFSQSGPSIFQFQNHTPPTSSFDFKKESDGEDDGDDEGVKEQSDEIDHTKVINDYVYENPYNKLIEKVLIKFKKDSEQVIQNVTVTVEQHKQNKNVYMFVRSKQTKTLLFQGQVLPKVSNVKIINNKSQNLNASVVEKKDKVRVASIKLQFLNDEDGNEFVKIFGDKVYELENPSK